LGPGVSNARPILLIYRPGGMVHQPSTANPGRYQSAVHGNIPAISTAGAPDINSRSTGFPRYYLPVYPALSSPLHPDPKDAGRS
jgi:hypothetical protein